MAAAGRQPVGIPSVGSLDLPLCGLLLAGGPSRAMFCTCRCGLLGSTILRRWLAGWRAKDLLSIFRGSGE